MMSSRGDLFLPDGIIAVNSGKITLSIINGDDTIWEEEISPRADQSYSTLLIAGGPSWESKGSYTIKAVQGSITEEISFDFR